MFCARCGKENTDSSAFCSSCGTKLGQVQLGKKRRLSTIAGMLDIVSAGLSIIIVICYWAFGHLSAEFSLGWPWSLLYIALIAIYLLIVDLDDLIANTVEKISVVSHHKKSDV